MKKILAAATVVIVLSLAGSAMAYEGRHHGRGPGRGPCWEQGGYKEGWHGGQRGPGPRGEWGGPMGQMRPGARHNWNRNAPQEIRDKMAAAEKLMIDLRYEMTKPQVDKAKALEIWKQHRALRNEIAEWRFAQRLEWAANRPATPPAQPQ